MAISCGHRSVLRTSGKSTLSMLFGGGGGGRTTSVRHDRASGASCQCPEERSRAREAVQAKSTSSPRRCVNFVTSRARARGSKGEGLGNQFSPHPRKTAHSARRAMLRGDNVIQVEGRVDPVADRRDHRHRARPQGSPRAVGPRAASAPRSIRAGGRRHKGREVSYEICERLKAATRGQAGAAAWASREAEKGFMRDGGSPDAQEGLISVGKRRRGRSSGPSTPTSTWRRCAHSQKERGQPQSASSARPPRAELSPRRRRSPASRDASAQGERRASRRAQGLPDPQT